MFAKEGCGQTYTLYLSKSGHLFRDVPTNSWYFESIDRAVSLDLLKGVGDFAYEPDGGLNRAMFVTMLARAVGEPPGQRSGLFRREGRPMVHGSDELGPAEKSDPRL